MSPDLWPRAVGLSSPCLEEDAAGVKTKSGHGDADVVLLGDGGWVGAGVRLEEEEGAGKK